jgi:hypothetical protein
MYRQPPVAPRTRPNSAQWSQNPAEVIVFHDPHAQENIMSDQVENAVPEDPATRYMNRVERRIRVLETLEKAGMGIYLPPDAKQRKATIDMLARLIARQRELPSLSRDTLAQAARLLEQRLEGMQKQLPSDVQYRNRIRSSW